MVRKFSAISNIILIAAILIVCLFADSVLLESKNYLGFLLHVAATILRDSGTQWMAFVCVVINLLTFRLLECQISGLRFWRLANPSLWLTGVLFLGTLIYAFKYSDAAQSTQALMLLAGASVGVGARVWSVWRQQGSYGGCMGCLIVATLTVLLLAASLWPPESGPSFAFRGYDVRSTGPWDNPNIFGLLMGVGIVLAIGCAVLNFKLLSFSQSDAGSWKGLQKWLKVAFVVLCLTSTGLLGRGLLHSYSRGAWCGTIVGLVYLAVQRINGREARCGRWIRANLFSLGVAAVSILALTFWYYRATEWYPARRAFSVTNRSDFTWRDRVAAWECALQITAEQPCFGAGWNQPGRLYERYYSLPEVPESAFIGLNDYLLLGATLGIPALFCFGMYIWLCLGNGSWKSGAANLIPKGSPPTLNFGLWTSDSLQAICRAGAIVLLVGFWFDGGLFKLPTAATFWILIELGRLDLTMGSAK